MGAEEKIINAGQPVVDPVTTFTPESLSTTFERHRTELMTIPMHTMAEAMKYMGFRDGIRYKEHVHDLKGDFQMGNYDKYKKGSGAVEIGQRTLQTFFGNCIEPIDPNSIYKSLWGSDITKGDGLKNVPWVKRVCAYMMAKLGENIYKVMWTAKHDENDKTSTSKWFDGFCTIEDQEKAAGTMSKELGNYYELPEDINYDNAEDVINDFFWGDSAAGWAGIDGMLRNQNVNIFMSDRTKHCYEVAYQKNHGSLPYNTQFTKGYIEGKPNAQFVALGNVPDNYLCITPRQNILTLWNMRGEDETFIVKESKTSHYDVDFIANMFYGEQYLSIDKANLCVARKKQSL